jgi:hypothetical protein
LGFGTSENLVACVSCVLKPSLRVCAACVVLRGPSSSRHKMRQNLLSIIHVSGSPSSRLILSWPSHGVKAKEKEVSEVTHWFTNVVSRSSCGKFVLWFPNRYNKICQNCAPEAIGNWSCENHDTLQRDLKDRLGFEGCVRVVL